MGSEELVLSIVLVTGTGSKTGADAGTGASPINTSVAGIASSIGEVEK
jgi:hypothetical protein